MNAFDLKLKAHDLALSRSQLSVLQVNLGKLCNLTCFHCHVEAGPTQTAENMTLLTAQAVVGLMDKLKPSTLDLTGGAPEMNPYFSYLVDEAVKRDIHVIDRCNLTILMEPAYKDMASFLSERCVEIIASLPCYSKDNVDLQRGNGTFDQSIEALRLLNRMGYGREESRKTLNLVYNPVGAHLPPEQAVLEADYKQRLKDDFGIFFNRLYTIVNMPITRYAKYLKARGEMESYQTLLVESFNPATIDGLMCRDTLSIGWDGSVYDCDFNQMLKINRVSGQKQLTVFDLLNVDYSAAPIQTGEHCFGCTAGSGSSCQGALAS